CGNRRGSTLFTCLAIAAPRTAIRAPPRANAATSLIARAMSIELGCDATLSMSRWKVEAEAEPKNIDHGSHGRHGSDTADPCRPCDPWSNSSFRFSGIAPSGATRQDALSMTTQHTSPRVLVMG